MNEYEKVKAENDWTAQQVARFPDRLIGFCGFNPLEDYALDELARCAKSPQLRHGIKLHFGNSVVDYHNRDHVERVKKVFAAANQHRMAISVHMRGVNLAEAELRPRRSAHLPRRPRAGGAGRPDSDRASRRRGRLRRSAGRPGALGVRRRDRERRSAREAALFRRDGRRAPECHGRSGQPRASNPPARARADSLRIDAAAGGNLPPREAGRRSASCR